MWKIGFIFRDQFRFILGDIIKISRGITKLRAVSSKRQDGLLPHFQSEFVYAHTSCRQKYILIKNILKCIRRRQMKFHIRLRERSSEVALIYLTLIGKKHVSFVSKKLINKKQQNWKKKLVREFLWKM